jgi:NAD(P)-dependent dehydrogenase (short-subunit alcohol dehydrogenase family)
MILVTGAARGLGAAIALALSKSGHQVVIHYRSNQLQAAKMAAQCNAPMIQGDFSSPELTRDFIRRYKEQFPETEGIVNNVSQYLLSSLVNTSEEKWQELFQINLHAPFTLIQALLPTLKTVVNIGQSGLLAHRAAPYAAAYRSTKQALYYMTLSFAKELASQNITVNMVSPGFLENAVDLLPLDSLPMKRAGKLDEVAEIVVTLFSDKARYITGQNIEIAGGVGL